ncbi:MAG TPA: penicillin acylase family protein, partial [Bryobacteraceae bacterium]|nr:penicillin acylase family protein [Bryobacteraceae bacterium]
MKIVLLLALAASAACAATEARVDARNVTIVRDDWGIAHISGKTDADAVFGMIYTQCEDDFNRVESNYLTSLGRTAEAEGESKIWQDLRQRLFIDPVELKKQYAESPAWLQTLMNAWADGLNYYLSKHPEVKPKVITHWEPWMALSFTEGSIGGDIERVNLRELEAFYGKKSDVALLEPVQDAEPRGSNGAAIAPANTTGHHALLLINPHTSFFFRSELQMTSNEGLNAYGAVTWGQFFIYQGFNSKTGWMHTSSGVDAVDEFLEDPKGPHTSKEVTIQYKTPGGMQSRKFTTYYTKHGPVEKATNGKWVTIALMQENIKALEQSYLRTKTTDYKSYKKTMELYANSSNNTIFADADGDIAYWHGNYIPKRDTKFDWTKPVDGTNPATDYKGLMTVDEIPHLLNPKSGWLYNSNNWPWSGAGESSLKKDDFPAYVEMHGESARGLHAVKVLKDKKDFTLDSLLAAAFDSYLTWFDEPLPRLLKAYDAAPRPELAEQIGVLRKWNQRWAADSVATSVAIFWGEQVRRGVEDASPKELLDGLKRASDKLAADFGKWQTPWGDINRFQRINDDIVPHFDDAGPSIPVAFASATYGSLASFGARAYPNTKKWYGTSGNSFVAVVEFGPTVRARAVTAGGESGDPASKHFNDEATRYATGN